METDFRCQPGTARPYPTAQAMLELAVREAIDALERNSTSAPVVECLKAALDRASQPAAQAPEPVAWGRVIDGKAITLSRERTLANDEPLFAQAPAGTGGDVRKQIARIINPVVMSATERTVVPLDPEEKTWIADTYAKADAIIALSPPAPDAGRASVIEQCAKIADLWVTDCGHIPTKYLNARDYAVDAVKDVADAIRGLSVTRPTRGTP